MVIGGVGGVGKKRQGARKNGDYCCSCCKFWLKPCQHICVGRWQIRNWYKGGLLDPDAREALVCMRLDASSIRWGEDQSKEKKKCLFFSLDSQI